MIELFVVMFLTVAMVLLDGFLTGKSVGYFKKIEKKMRFEVLELNPLWQGTYGKGQKFNKKILIPLLMLIICQAILWFFSRRAGNLQLLSCR